MSCPANEHLFQVAKKGYYKRDGTTIAMLGGAARHDQSVSYCMLFCQNCGETKEIIEADHRRKDS